VCKRLDSSHLNDFQISYQKKEEFDRDGTQLIPSGFHLIHLPYADDIRQLKFEPQPKATTEQIVKAKKLVKTLRIKFDSRNFENPGTLSQTNITCTLFCSYTLTRLSLFVCFCLFTIYWIALQRHYANLQAIALDREVLEETPDYVVPDEEGMAKVD
jgi:ATP-dependent DNA helicase 2 subunit 1